jgi:hypothetical protein
MVAAYCAAMGWSMLDTFVFFVGGKAAEWFFSVRDAYAAKNMILTIEALHAEFLSYFDPATRDEERDARTKLHEGECSMTQYPSVKQYEQEFKLLTRIARDLSETDQISWFWEGLSPSLKPMCVVDSNGKDWKSLDALIDYAHGAELRLDANKRAHQAHKAAVVSRQTSRSKSKFSRPATVRPQQIPVPSEIPQALAGLYRAAIRLRWAGDGTAPLSASSFLRLMRDEKCLQCGAKLVNGRCAAHPRRKKEAGKKRPADA